MKNRVAQIRKQLSDKDYRLTPQREAILRVLLANEDQHLSAEDIYLATRSTNPDIGLATVYRTLELFVKMGIIYRLQSGDGQNRYEYNPRISEHYHHHLICLGCGKITEWNDDLLEAVEKQVEQQTNFQITDHTLKFYGYCESCSKGRGPQEV